MLEVNLANMSVTVFRKGRPLSRHKRWTYGDAEVEVVNSYKYLGLTLTTKLSTTQALADFIPNAKEKIIAVLKKLRKINCPDWRVLRFLTPKFNQRCCTHLRYGVQAEWKLLQRYTYLLSRGS